MATIIKEGATGEDEDFIVSNEPREAMQVKTFNLDLRANVGHHNVIQLEKLAISDVEKGGLVSKMLQTKKVLEGPEPVLNAKEAPTNIFGLQKDVGNRLRVSDSVWIIFGRLRT